MNLSNVLHINEKRPSASFDRASQEQIAHVARRFSPGSWGGMETRVLELCRLQQSESASPKIYTTDIYEATGESKVGEIPIERFPYQYPALGLPEERKEEMDHVGGNLLSWGLFGQLMKERDLKLIHAHCTKRLGAQAWMASRLRRVPFVLSLHGDVMTLPTAQEERFSQAASEGLEWSKAIGWLLRSRNLLQLADAVIAVGWKEYQALRENIDPKRVHFVPGGVDATRFRDGEGNRFRTHLNIPQETPLLVQVGRIDPQKNQALSIETLGLLRAQGIDARLVCVGPITDPGYFASLQQQITEQKLSGAVHFLQLGYRDPLLVDAFHAADVFLQPSLHEPFGLTVLEAWCAKKPVIASNIGGLEQLLQGGGGFSLQPQHAMEWSFRVSWLLQHKERAQELGEEGYQKVMRKYLWGHAKQRIDTIYQSVLGEKY